MSAIDESGGGKAVDFEFGQYLHFSIFQAIEQSFSLVKEVEFTQRGQQMR